MDEIVLEDDIVECCMVCGRDVVVMIFRGTRLCSQLCEKKWNQEQPKEQALNP